MCIYNIYIQWSIGQILKLVESRSIVKMKQGNETYKIVDRISKKYNQAD